MPSGNFAITGIISKFTLRRASESIVEHLCKWSAGSFLLVHVLGDVSARVVSPLQEKQSMDYCRLVAFVCKTRLCVCLCVFVWCVLFACMPVYEHFVLFCLHAPRAFSDNCLSAPLLFDTGCAYMDFSVLVLGLIPVFINFDHLLFTCTHRETWRFISLCLITAYYSGTGLWCLGFFSTNYVNFSIFLKINFNLEVSRRRAAASVLMFAQVLYGSARCESLCD